jgi:hypothetical protein
MRSVIGLLLISEFLGTCYGTGIAQLVERLGYGLDDQEIGVRFQAGGKDSLPHNVQIRLRPTKPLVQ